MFGAAFGAISGGTSNSGYAVDMSGGIKGMGERLQQAAADKQALLDSYTNPAAATPEQSTGLAGGGATSAPNIPMSDSYNSAASLPVFPPATQEKAAAVFGTNDQRQASTNGFKQEIKERIMKDISSL
jgi:hypothetical protein